MGSSWDLSCVKHIRSSQASQRAWLARIVQADSIVSELELEAPVSSAIEGPFYEDTEDPHPLSREQRLPHRIKLRECGCDLVFVGGRGPTLPLVSRSPCSHVTGVACSWKGTCLTGSRRSTRSAGRAASSCALLRRRSRS